MEGLENLNDLPDQELYSLVKEVGLQDLYFFNKYLMGFRDMEKKPHLSIINHLLSSQGESQSGVDRKLYLLPRGSFKTSVVTIGYVAWRLQRDRSLRVLLSHHTFEDLKGYLGQIKESMTSKLMMGLYGDPRRRVGGKVQDWTKTSITCHNPKAEAGYATKESSIDLTSPKAGSTGSHYDLVILDDVVGKENIGTREQLEKVIQHYKEIEAILDPGCELIVIGTTWSDNDLYDHIQTELSDIFSIMKRPATDDATLDGELLFPEVLTRAHLAEKKQTMGEAMFEAQYMLNPFSSATTVFDGGDLKKYNQSPDNCIRFLKIDPAISESKQSSDSGFVIVDVDHLNNFYFHDFYSGKLNEMSIASTIMDYAVANDVDSIVMESLIFQRLLKPLLLAEMEERGIYIPFIEVKGVVKNKHLRILSFQPKVEGGKFYVHDDIYDEAKTMMTRYQFQSTNKRIDVLDALCSYNDRLFPPDPNEVEATTNQDIKDMQLQKEKEDIKKLIDKATQDPHNSKREVDMEANYLNYGS